MRMKSFRCFLANDHFDDEVNDANHFPEVIECCGHDFCCLFFFDSFVLQVLFLKDGFFHIFPNKSANVWFVNHGCWDGCHILKP